MSSMRTCSRKSAPGLGPHFLCTIFLSFLFFSDGDVVGVPKDEASTHQATDSFEEHVPELMQNMHVLSDGHFARGKKASIHQAADSFEEHVPELTQNMHVLSDGLSAMAESKAPIHQATDSFEEHVPELTQNMHVLPDGHFALAESKAAQRGAKDRSKTASSRALVAGEAVSNDVAKASQLDLATRTSWHWRLLEYDTEEREWYVPLVPRPIHPFFAFWVKWDDTKGRPHHDDDGRDWFRQLDLASCFDKLGQDREGETSKHCYWCRECKPGRQPGTGVLDSRPGQKECGCYHTFWVFWRIAEMNPESLDTAQLTGPAEHMTNTIAYEMAKPLNVSYDDATKTFSWNGTRKLILKGPYTTKGRCEFFRGLAKANLFGDSGVSGNCAPAIEYEARGSRAGD